MRIALDSPLPQLKQKERETSYHNYILTKVAGKEYVYKGEPQQVADYTKLRYTQVVMSDGVAKDLKKRDSKPFSHRPAYRSDEGRYVEGTNGKEFFIRSEFF
jgi:hypothetical protein